LCSNVKQIRYQFWCTRCAFRLLKSRQWYLGRKKVGSPKIVGKSRKYQILWHGIEPNPSKDRSMHEGDNPSFLNEFMRFTLYLIVVFIFVFLSKLCIMYTIKICSYHSWWYHFLYTIINVTCIFYLFYFCLKICIHLLINLSFYLFIYLTIYLFIYLPSIFGSLIL
jgi:hypothetical protein